MRSNCLLSFHQMQEASTVKGEHLLQQVVALLPSSVVAGSINSVFFHITSTKILIKERCSYTCKKLIQTDMIVRLPLPRYYYTKEYQIIIAYQIRSVRREQRDHVHSNQTFKWDVVLLTKKCRFMSGAKRLHLRKASPSCILHVNTITTKILHQERR